jgi:hypothetical protein
VENFPFCNLSNGARLDSSHFRDGMEAWLTAASGYFDGKTSVVVRSTFQKRTFKRTFDFPNGLTLDQFRTSFLTWYATSYQYDFEAMQDESAFNGEDIPSAVLGATVTSYFAITEEEVNTRLHQCRAFNDQGDNAEKVKLPYQHYWRLMYVVIINQLGSGSGDDRRSHTQFQNATANLKNSNTGDLILYNSTNYPTSSEGRFGFDVLNAIVYQKHP